MKILVAILETMYYDSSLKSLEWATFWPACQKLGEARLFPYGELEKQYSRESMNHMLLMEVGSFQPDVVFVATFQDNFLPGTLESIKVPTIAWFSDAYREDHIRQVAPHYSHLIVMDEKAEKVAKESGKPVRRSMWACNPDLHKPTSKERDLDIVWIGLGEQPDRVPYIKALVDHFPQAMVCGKGCPRPPVKAEEYGELYGRAKIGISLSLNVKGQPQPKARPFEICGCNAMLLASKPNTLQGYLRENIDYIGFTTVEDMVEECYYYLSHPKEREVIAHTGYQYTLKYHTYTQRLKAIFDWALETI